MKHYTDIFLDFDDTIYDTRSNADLALRELYEAYDLEGYFASFADFATPYWEANTALWSAYSHGEISRETLIVERFRRPLATARGLIVTPDLCLRMSDTFLDLCACKSGLNPGARELLDYLHGRYRLHVCSNGFHEVQMRKLQSSDTLRYFATIVLSEDAGANKPSPRFFDYALRLTGAQREHTVMIGDNYNTDITGADISGIDAIFFDRWEVGEKGVATHRVTRLLDIVGLL